jgi:adenylate cyclase
VPQEIELKLALPRSALAALRKHPLVAATERCGTAQTLVNTYYDTPDLRLRAAKIGVRTRRQGRRWLQTVKCAGEMSGGLASRPEWEQPYLGSFDFSAITAAPVRELLDRHHDALVPIFTTRFRRETRRYATGAQVEILLMIDSGEVEVEDRRSPICELELELVQGSEADLFDLARQLAADLPLLPEDVSKAERGYRLFLDKPARPQRAGASSIGAKDTPLTAFRRLAADCLRQWQANAMGAAESDDPEFVHQMRVALRRLRSLLRLMGPALPEAFSEAWSERLREETDRLGGPRDLDVLQESILQPVRQAAPQLGALEQLAGRVEAERTRQRRVLARWLAQAGRGLSILDFAAALHGLQGNALDAAADLPTFARLQLSQLTRRVAKRSKQAAALDPAALHSLRIALKRLRYATEFFLPLLPGKAGARFIKEVARAQDRLGYLNDVAVARSHLATLADADTSLREAVAFVSGWHGAQTVTVQREALAAVAALLARRKPW